MISKTVIRFSIPCEIRTGPAEHTGGMILKTVPRLSTFLFKEAGPLEHAESKVLKTVTVTAHSTRFRTTELQGKSVQKGFLGFHVQLQWVKNFRKPERLKLRKVTNLRHFLCYKIGPPTS